ncbi:MAG: CBS domain-containing protein [Candidatus Omnitrophica bacterium]|nr:CBS domain-containing protein [Candidatus Omnitrophota bacterium]
MNTPLDLLNAEKGERKGKKSAEKTFFGLELSSPEWLIKETGFGLDPQHIQESLFTLGNGFIGSRGVLEEIPESAMPGTFIAGLYDKSGAQVEELVNLPNPINFIVAAEGEKLDMRFMEYIKHVRYLDMQKGMVFRRTVFQDGKKRRFLYKSLRFFSMNNPNLLEMKVSITLLNGKAELTALDIMDDSVANYGGLIYGFRRHFRLMDVDTKSDVLNYYAFRTHTSKIWVAYADFLMMERDGRQVALHDRFYDFELKAGETITFTKTMAITTSLQYRVSNLKEETLRILNNAVSAGFERNAKDHIETWKTIWEHANIKIDGDELCDRALRFNIYHLVIAGFKGNFPMNIGARALTGQGYRGHIFWDSEIFMLPFYIYTDPLIAKNILLYRYYRLNGARSNAKVRGYQGVLFPWESGSKGDDVTPRYAKDIDGSVIKIETIEYEQHITADIAYGVYNYYRATEDTDFMVNQGAEIVMESARFWASRVTFNLSRKKYEIHNVIGPDEFHINVKNNSYTNYMAAWNLEYAHDIYHDLKKNNPQELEDLMSKIRLSEKEVAAWKEIGDNMFIPISKKTGIIEQFEGYFKKKETVVRNYDKQFMPEAPSHYSYSDFDKTQFIKQADTLLLFNLFPERFTAEEKRKNYRFYIKRTLHQSSLSHSSHCLIAAQLGDYLRAFALYLFAVHVDLKNLHNNTDGGMHMANVGGVWQATVFGFAGLSFYSDAIAVNPVLPRHWKEISFNLFWKKSLLKVSVNNKMVSIICYPMNSNQSGIKAIIFNKEFILEPFKIYEFKRKARDIHMRRVRDIMRKDSFISANEDTPVRRISHFLVDHNISSVPIIDSSSQLQGIVSEQDILKVTDSDLSKLKAKDIMNKSVEYVKEDDHIEIAIRIFTERPFRMLPVLRGKTVVGVLSRQEVLSACTGEYY